MVKNTGDNFPDGGGHRLHRLAGPAHLQLHRPAGLAHTPPLGGGRPHGTAKPGHPGLIKSNDRHEALGRAVRKIWLIDQTTATRNPFDKKYSKVEDAAWETCASVLNPISVRELMETGWG